MAGTKRLFRVGSKILEIRSAFGLTQGELGTLIGVHVVTVNRCLLARLVRLWPRSEP